MINREFIFTLASRGMLLFAGLLGSIITAHYLGPSGRGNYFYVMTLVTLLTQLGTLGLQSSNTRELVKNPTLLGQLAINTLWISFIAGLILALISILAITSIHKKIAGLALVTILTPATLFYLLGVNLLVGINRIKTFNLLQIGTNLFLCLSLLLAGIMNFDAQQFLSVTAFTWVCGDIALILILLCYTKLTIKFNPALFSSTFKFSMKVYIATLFGMLVLKGNVFLLRYFVTSDILGYYSVAIQINDALIIIPSTYALLLLPKLIKNPSNSFNLTWKSLILVSFFMLICCIAAAIMVKPVIPFLFGKKFIPSAPILLWMLPGTFFLSIIAISSQFLSARGFPKILVFYWAGAFLLVSILSWLLIPKFSAIGAAMSLSITYACLAVTVLGLLIWTKYKVNEKAYPTGNKDINTAIGNI